MPSLMISEQAVLTTSEKLQKTSLNTSSPGNHGQKEEQGLKGHCNDMEEMNEVLPEDIQDLVLARLPISALYKARPVCKRWHSLLTHPPFLNLRVEIWGAQQAVYFPLLFWQDDCTTPQGPSAEDHAEHVDEDPGIAPVESSSLQNGAGNGQLQTFTTWSWLGYDSAMGQWQAMKQFVTPSHVKNVVIGSKGLICLRGDNSLFVVNPMTGAQREVPLKENIVQFIVDVESNTFRIIAAGSRKRTKIYDSETRVWSKRGRPPPNLALSPHVGAFCNGVLYCVAQEERSGKWGVAGYDVEGASRVWTDMVFFPLHLGEIFLKARVIQCGGEIFSLLEKEVLEDDVGPRTKSLSLWKLERNKMKWTLAGTMPWPARQHLINLEDFNCIAHGERICIFNKSTFKVVECHFFGGVVTSWHHLHLDSHFSAGKPLFERLIVCFAFDPNLLTSV